MAVAFRQGKTWGTADNTSTTGLNSGAFPSAAVAGDSILVWIANNNAANSTSVTDSAGNTYTALYQNLNAGGNYLYSLWYAQNITGGSNFSINLIHSSANWAVTAQAQEFSGTVTSSVIHASNQATGTYAATYTNPSATSTITDYMAVGLFSGNLSNATITAGTNYSNLQGVNGSSTQVYMESRALTTTGAQAPTFGTSTSGFTTAAATVLLAGTAGGAGVTYARQLTTVGVG